MMEEEEWPGDWEPASNHTAPRLLNDHGILYLIGKTGSEYLHMENPPEMSENHC